LTTDFSDLKDILRYGYITTFVFPWPKLTFHKFANTNLSYIDMRL